MEKMVTVILADDEEHRKKKVKNGVKDLENKDY